MSEDGQQLPIPHLQRLLIYEVSAALHILSGVTQAQQMKEHPLILELIPGVVELMSPILHRCPIHLQVAYFYFLYAFLNETDGPLEGFDTIRSNLLHEVVLHLTQSSGETQVSGMLHYQHNLKGIF